MIGSWLPSQSLETNAFVLVTVLTTEIDDTQLKCLKYQNCSLTYVTSKKGYQAFRRGQC